MFQTKKRLKKKKKKLPSPYSSQAMTETVMGI